MFLNAPIETTFNAHARKKESSNNRVCGGEGGGYDHYDDHVSRARGGKTHAVHSDRMIKFYLEKRGKKCTTF